VAETVALGLRAHSGWAAAVVITGPAKAPVLIDRRIIQLADSQISGSKQPYHAAEGLAFKDAEQLVKQCTRSTYGLAAQGLKTVIADLRKQGLSVVGCGLLLGGGRSLPPLAGILASHALIHAAEGQLFRLALAEACEKSKLPVVGVKEKELHTRAAHDLGLTSERIQTYLKELGRTAGPPWREDQKCAVLAAWLALSA
jgi:hypothetical protein